MRAVDVLRGVSVVACEDKRVTGKLLKHIGVQKRLIAYHEHSIRQVEDEILDMLHRESVALVSDAGTPLISDPGWQLVKRAKDAGYMVTAIPGPSALIAALVQSGLNNRRFLFGGFMPRTDEGRANCLREVGDLYCTVILYETGPRLTKSLKIMAELWPNREIAVARELTKLYEECRSGTAEELLEHYTAHPPKGEIVLMAGPPITIVPEEHDVETMLRGLLKTEKPSQAATRVAKFTGRDRKELYKMALRLKAE